MRRGLIKATNFQLPTESHSEIVFVSSFDEIIFPSPEAALLLVSTKNRDLWGRSNLLSMPREFASYSQPIRFARLEPEHAQSDGKSVSRGLPVLDLPRGRDSWC